MSLIMGLFIMDNGLKKDLERVKAFKFGRMPVNMKGIGRMIKPTGMEGWFILTVIATMEIGSMIRLMEEEFMSMLMALSILEIGKKINSTGTE